MGSEGADIAERLRSRSSGGRFSGCVSSVNFQSLIFLENLGCLAGESFPLFFLVGDFDGERREDLREWEDLSVDIRFSLVAGVFEALFGEVEDLLKKLGRTISDYCVSARRQLRSGNFCGFTKVDDKVREY